MPPAGAAPSSLHELIARLSRFEPTEAPVLSLYLDLQPDQHGRDSFRQFLRKALKDRLRTFAAGSPARASLEQDAGRVTRYLEAALKPSANGLAAFACSRAGLFEAVQLDAPFDEHRLYLDAEPHLYPLARLDDRFPRYAALLADTNSARLFVFATGQVETEVTVQNVKTRRTAMGGWSQARYQRHVDNYHLLHVKEVVDVLDRVVRAERIPSIVIAGDEVVVPLLRDQLPPHLAEKIVDVMRLDVTTPQHEVLSATLERLREKDAENDEERVARLFDSYRSGGLAVVSPRETLAALANGQVDELLISARPDAPTGAAAGPAPREAAGMGGNGEPGTAADRLTEALAEELVTKATQTAARVTFIEDPELLREAGGVGAFLRFTL
jgi:peptide chain release factor subunit 1